jgi:(p)ppGpp synthase/HD superfamily hydrolase
MTGYSDRINHAFAFAAKHHDQQVRKGTRLPYLTRPANVAIILSRYDQDDDTIVGGILRDVVADFVREGYTAEMLDQRIGQKFGEMALRIAVAASERRTDDDGLELSLTERKEDFLERFGVAGTQALWVTAADELHALHSLLSELRRTVEPALVWRRLGLAKGGTVEWYRAVYDRLKAVGFDAPILGELKSALDTLNEFAAR